MAIKLIKFIFIIFVSFVLFGCPGALEEDQCSPLKKIANIDNLVMISPLKNNYNVGDLVIFKVSIPNVNLFFGDQINMLDFSNDRKGTIGTFFPLLKYNNNFTFVKGNKKNEYQYEMQFDNESNSYELEIIIEVVNKGNFTFYNSNPIDFGLYKGICPVLGILTNINGIDKTQPYQITVQ